MRGSGDNEQFLVAHLGTLAFHMLAGHALKGVLREVARVGILSMDEQHWGLYLVGPAEQRLVHERLATHYVPAIVAVAGTLVVAAIGLIVGMIVLHEPGSIVGQRVYDTTGTLLLARTIVGRALSCQGATLLHALFGRILALEVAFNVHLRHIVHG